MQFRKVVRAGGTLAIAGCMALFCATRAEATAVLLLFDGTTSVVIADNDGTDTIAATGAVGFNGTIGDWLVNVTTGITKPVLGSSASPHMDLNSVNVSTAPGTLVMAFSDTDFMYTGGFTMLVGGTVNGSAGSSLTYHAFADGTNLPGTGSHIGVLGPFGSGAFSGTGGGTAVPPVVGPYSLMQLVQIVHGAGGVSSFDAELVPEPASLALFGLGLLGAGLSARRFRRT